MLKINKKMVAITIIVILFLPVLISFLCNLADYIPLNIVNVGTNSDWISFWGSMLGAIFGIIGTFFVLQIQMKKDNERFEQTQIDNTFFNMLGLFQRVQEEVDKKKFCIKRYDFVEELFRKIDADVDIFSKILDEIIAQKNKFQLMERDKHVQTIYEQIDPYTKKEIKEELEDLIESIKYVDYTDPSFDMKNLIDDVIETVKNNSEARFCSAVATLEGKLDQETYLTQDDSPLISKTKALKDNLVEVRMNYKYEFTVENVKKIVDNVFSEYHSEVGNYLRIFHRLVKHTMNSKLDMEKKKEYLGIIRALLSSNEILVIFYNTFYSVRGEKLKRELSKEDKQGNKTEFFADEIDLKNFNIEDKDGVVDLPFFQYEELIFKDIDLTYIRKQVNESKK